MKQLLDLVEHTVHCGIENVRVCANGVIHAHASTDNKQIVFHAWWDEPPERCYGIAAIPELYSWLSNPNLDVVKQEGNLLTFQNNTSGNTVVYSFLSDERIAELVPYKKLKIHPCFEAVVTPPADFVNKLKQQRKIANTEGNNDPTPHLFAVKSHIDLQFGDHSTLSQGNLLAPAEYSEFGRWQWDVNDLINILSQSGTFKIGITGIGLMIIQCITEFATYQYALPGHSK